jgi:hypothetical protein
LLGVQKLFGSTLREWLFELLSRPTRYQSGAGLVAQRWFTIEKETGLALAQASFSTLVLLGIARRTFNTRLGIFLLLVLLAGDLWRVNKPFLVLTDPPNRTEAAVTPAMGWIKIQSHGAQGTGQEVPEYRVLLFGGSDPMRYASARIPVLFTANAVQKRRWQEYLDILSLESVLPDIMNVRWLVAEEKLYEQNKEHFGSRYPEVFRGGGEVVLENRQVLPKAWLVTRTELASDHAARLKRLQGPGFDPSKTALIESPPGLQLAPTEEPGSVKLEHYEGERISLTADSVANSLLVLGEKDHKGWKATVNGIPTAIVPVNHVLRGIYLAPGRHRVVFHFDPLPFRIGTCLTVGSFSLFGIIAAWEWWFWRRSRNAS